MKVQIVAPHWGRIRGGVEQHADDVARLLRERGHSVQVSNRVPASSDGDWLLFEGVDRRALWRGRRRPRDHRPKVGLFTHGTFLPLVHRAELRERGWTPTAGELARRWFDLRVMDRCLESVDQLFLLSRREADDFGRQFPRHLPRAMVVPVVVHESDRVAVDPPADAGPYVTAVSRLDRRKHFSVVIEALAGTDVRFRLAGQDNGDLARLRRAARNAGYGGLEILGPVSSSQAQALYRGAVATVLPSYFEGVPLMLLQSLAQGTPGLTTDLCYADPIDGLTFERPDAESWRRRLLSWTEGGRPGVGVPPGPQSWAPMIHALENSTS